MSNTEFPNEKKTCPRIKTKFVNKRFAFSSVIQGYVFCRLKHYILNETFEETYLEPCQMFVLEVRKQHSRSVLIKRCSENIHQISRRNIHAKV